MAFVKFLKTENLTKNIWEFYIGWVLMPIQPQLDTMQMLTHSLLKFWSIYSFQYLTAVTVFNIKPLNFQNILSLTCSFHFWHLQSANIRFSINSKSVTRYITKKDQLSHSETCFETYNKYFYSYSAYPCNNK